MPFYKNNGSAVERPGDGTFDSHVVESGAVVEAAANPAPGLFEETKTKPAKTADQAEE